RQQFALSPPSSCLRSPCHLVTLSPCHPVIREVCPTVTAVPPALAFPRPAPAVRLFSGPPGRYDEVGWNPKRSTIMTDYQIQARSRRCVATGRELVPGERYFSVLLDEGDSFVRQDFSLEAWQGPPEKTFSFWQGRLPSGGAPKRPAIDDELLLDCFARL